MNHVRLGLLACLLTSPLGAAPLETKKTDDGVTITVNGQLFTRYLVKSGAKPILWPLVGPTGKEMTRGFPMRPATPEEKADHPHQRSLWFTHGSVNGVDFWAETPKSGQIVHREFVKVEGGPEAVIVTKNDWLAPDGTKVCEDERTFTFGADSDRRWIDCDLVVKPAGGPLTFGDTKEGSFGVRVPGTMDVTAKKGGRIVNSEGQSNEDAWGKPATWVDYYGPVEGETLGIALLNHPSSFRHPTTWHVRTYGLFASNPFGLKDFKTGKDGTHTVAVGQTLVLRHRVLLHKGDEKQGRVAETFLEYAKQK